MKNILFVSERAIKDSSVIEQNFPDKMLRVQIAEAQDLELLPIIGDTMYQQLETEVTNKATDPNYQIPQKYLDLLAAVKPFLIYTVLVTIIVPVTYQYTPKGLATKTDTSSQMASGTDLQYVRNFYSTKQDVYKQRLLKTFGKSCSAGFVGPNDLGRSTGWYIDGTSQSSREVAQALENKTIHK